MVEEKNAGFFGVNYGRLPGKSLAASHRYCGLDFQVQTIKRGESTMKTWCRDRPVFFGPNCLYPLVLRIALELIFPVCYLQPSRLFP